VAVKRTGNTLPYKYPSFTPLQFPGNPRQIADTTPLLSYPLVIGGFWQIATIPLLPLPMPLSGSLEYLTLSHKIPYVPVISCQPATTCDTPSPFFCHLLAAHDSSQPLLSYFQLLPLLGSLQHLAIAPPSPLISVTPWQLPVVRERAFPSFLSFPCSPS